MHAGDRGGGVDPHREQREPAEELHHRQLAHRPWHVVQVAEDAAQRVVRPQPAQGELGQAVGHQQAGQDVELRVQAGCGDHHRQHHAGQQPGRAVPCQPGPVERRALHDRRLVPGLQLGRRVLAAAQHGPAHRQQQHRAAEVERVAHRVRHLPGPGGVVHAARGQQERQRTGHHRTDADEEALHRVAARALADRQLVADEGPERLHRDVDRGVQHPQRAGGDPQHRRVGHHEQRQRRQHGTDQEVRPAPAQRRPGAVGQVAHDRLDDQPGQRGGDPQQRDLVHLRAEGLEDPADVRVLQCEAELDAQEPEAHVPDLPERQFRLAGAVSLHVGSPRRWRFRPMVASAPRRPAACKRIHRRLPRGGHIRLHGHGIVAPAATGPGARRTSATHAGNHGQRAQHGHRLVAWRGDLPDLPAQLPGHQRRRDRRPAGDHRAPGPRRQPGRGGDLGLAVLHLADGRLRLRHRRLPRRGPDVRHPGRLRPPAGEGTRAGHQGDDRPGPEPQLGRAPVVHREPRQPRQPARRLVRVGRPEARRHAAQQLALAVRRWRLDLGAAPRAVLPAQLPVLAAAAELPQPGRARRDARQPALLAGPGRGRHAPGLDQLLLPRRTAARQPAQAGAPARGPRLQRRQSLRLPVPPLQQHPAGERRADGGAAGAVRPVSRRDHPGRDLHRGFAGDHGRVRHRQAPAHGLQLRAAGRGPQRGLHPQDGGGPGSADDRRLAVLGDLQPRRAARGDPLGRARSER